MSADPRDRIYTISRDATRGGGLEVLGVKMNFAAVVVVPVQPATIAPNIGVPGMPITDSSSQLILDTLRAAVTTDIVVIDFENGQAWWETRLVVLCAGAVRLRHPTVIVFLATEAGQPGRFLGWAHPDALFPLLLDLKKEYRRSYFDAQIAAAQWAVIQPPAPGQGVSIPPGVSPLASKGAHVAPFMNGEVNALATEQFLALALGEFEMNPGPAPISAVRFKSTFAAALHFDATRASRQRNRRSNFSPLMRRTWQSPIEDVIAASCPATSVRIHSYVPSWRGTERQPGANHASVKTGSIS